MRKRIRERKQLQEKLNVYNALTKKFIGYLVDISDMGISLVGKHKIKVNEFMKFTIELHKPINDRKMIQFDGISVWSQPQPAELHLIGVQMLNIKPEDKAILESLVEEYQRPQEEA